MRLNINCKFFFPFVFMIILCNQMSFGKFLFPPDDSLNNSQSLNGHRFIINNQIGSPFIQTYIQMLIGASQTVNLNVPVITINSEKVAEIQGEIVYTIIDLEYQQAIRDWMAFRAKVVITVNSGTETGALISEGVNLSNGYELSWLFKLYRNKRFALSGSLELLNRSYTVVNLKTFIQGVLDSGRIVKSNNLVNTVPSTRAGGSLKFCYAFNPTFGFGGNINLLYGESIDRTAKSQAFFDYGGAFDANLLPKLKIPIGILAGFYHNAISATTEQVTSDLNSILFQINYTGKEDLNLGLEVNYRFYQPSDFDEKIKLMNLSLNLRYFF